MLNLAMRKQKLKYLFVLLSLIAIVYFINFHTYIGWGKVYSQDDLVMIGDNLNGKYVLMNDLDMTDYEGKVGFGTHGQPFTGIFDGNGYKIEGLEIDNPTLKNQGFFGVVDNAKIHNVWFKDVNIIGDINVGAAVAYALDSRISNIAVSGEIAGKGNVAAVVGRMYNSRAQRLSSDAYIEGGFCVGGLVGQNDKDSSIENSYFDGAVVGKFRVGQITGFSYKSKVMNSYGNGTVDYQGNDSSYGGLVGFTRDSEVVESYWNVDKMAKRIQEGGTPLNGEDMKKAKTYKEWDPSIWDIDQSKEEGFPSLKNHVRK